MPPAIPPFRHFASPSSTSSPRRTSESISRLRRHFCDGQLLKYVQMLKKSMNSQVSTGSFRNVGAKLWSHWKLKVLGQVPLVRNSCRFKMNILEDTFLNNGMNWAICDHETWQWLQWFCRSGPKAVPPPSLPQQVKQVDGGLKLQLRGVAASLCFHLDSSTPQSKVTRSDMPLLAMSLAIHVPWAMQIHANMSREYILYKLLCWLQVQEISSVDVFLGRTARIDGKVSQTTVFWESPESQSAWVTTCGEQTRKPRTSSAKFCTEVMWTLHLWAWNLFRETHNGRQNKRQ